jgi:hypothetical protein
MTARTALAVAASAALFAVLTACSSSDEQSGSAAEDSHHQETAVSHVHGLGADPADGALYVATHEGVVSVDEDGAAERVSDQADYMGFTVTGPGTFLGSGHPAPGSDEPPNR